MLSANSTARPLALFVLEKELDEREQHLLFSHAAGFRSLPFLSTETRSLSLMRDPCQLSP